MQASIQEKSVGERSIGAILIERGRLTAVNAERILREQTASNTRFGDAALKLGLLTEEDIRFALANQFEYPYLEPKDKSVSDELVAAFNPSARIIEQIRALRTQLMLRWFNIDAKRKSIAVVSLDSGDGRSFIAANLAVVFSQLGERTLLIDADMRGSRLHQMFKIPNNVGLSAVLAGRADPREAVVKVNKLLGLSVLPAGAAPPNPQELLSRDSFSTMLNTYKADYDIILIDTPAASECADAQAISSRVGAAFLVACNNRTPSTALEQLADTLRDSNVAIVGAILNDFDVQSSRSGKSKEK